MERIPLLADDRQGLANIGQKEGKKRDLANIGQQERKKKIKNIHSDPEGSADQDENEYGNVDQDENENEYGDVDQDENEYGNGDVDEYCYSLVCAGIVCMAWLCAKIVNILSRPKMEQTTRHPKMEQTTKNPKVHGHFKVPHQLRQVNKTAYEPRLISIGPCHRHKKHLQDMEVIKMQYFNRLFNEKGEEIMNRCLEAISIMEEEAGNWYAATSSIEVKVQDWREAVIRKMEEEVRDWWFAAMRKMKEKDPTRSDIEEDSFRLMILVDGCFIIQLLCKDPQDQFAKLRWSRLTLLGDLLLLENQLPFFVLVKLYGLIKDPKDGSDFAPQAFAKFIKMLPGSMIGTVNLSTMKDTNEINHLLGLVHDNWIPSPQGIQSDEDCIATEKEKELKGQVEPGQVHDNSIPSPQGILRHQDRIAKEKEKELNVRVERQSIGCARELEEAGIKFIKLEEGNLFDVNFKDGKMKIPKFVIDGNTERLFRNLIAYELFVEGSTYVIDYVTLMDNLVNTANDVRLLRSCGVIQNMLGDDKAVAQMLNKFRDCVPLCSDTFFYEETIVNVQEYCKWPWNTWKAKLKHDCFRNPWIPISHILAVLFFLIKIISFIFSFF